MFPRGCGTRSRVDFIFLIREKIAHAKVAKAAKARILDVGCFPAVAGRAYARIFDWGRDCSRKAPTRVRGRAAKDAKDGKGKIFDYFPKLWDARDVALG